MNILQEAYFKKLTETDRNIQFWEDYLRNLNSLDLSQFSANLKVPALVPIGTRILFRGELKHTNEVTVAMGADYFVKCSLSQAEVLRQHRIKDAQSKLNVFVKEKEYLENQMNFTKSNIYDMEGHEIVEKYTEEEDRVWRQKHRENVRQYKQSKVKEPETNEVDITDEELWNRLEELELKEELECELDIVNESIVSDQNNFVIKEDDTLQIKPIKEKEDKTKTDKETENENKKKTPQQTSKFDLLQQVINRQNELENKLFEIKNKESKVSQNENDLIKKLDEMEQLDELEDEMDRLDDIIENEDIVEDADDKTSQNEKNYIERRVSFVDDDSETLELTFKHSNVEPNSLPYNPEKGILKPSDIYKAYSNLFNTETTSILKKSKYESIEETSLKQSQSKPIVVDSPEETEVIVVKDIVEKDQPCDKLGNSSRPTSLFKKRRMQNKS